MLERTGSHVDQIETLAPTLNHVCESNSHDRPSSSSSRLKGFYGPSPVLPLLVLISRLARSCALRVEAMPKFFCDYCDVYLTHDSMSVRKAHNTGRNHLRNVVDYYQQIGHEKAQSVIDSITNSYAAEGQSSNNPMLPQNQPMGGMMGGFPPGFTLPGGPPPGMPQGVLYSMSGLLDVELDADSAQGMPPLPFGRGLPPGRHPSHITGHPQVLQRNRFSPHPRCRCFPAGYGSTIRVPSGRSRLCWSAKHAFLPTQRHGIPAKHAAGIHATRTESSGWAATWVAHGPASRYATRDGPAG